MLEINLLPEDLKKSAPSPVRQLHRSPLIWVAVISIVGYWLLLQLQIVGANRKFAFTQAEIQRLQPQQVRAQQLQKTIEDLKLKYTAFGQLKQGHLWAERLNVISDLIPDVIWLNELMMDASEGLVIKGTAIEQDGRALASVGKYVQGLNHEPAFNTVFKRLEIDSIKRSMDERIELVQFLLIAEAGGADE